MAGEKIKVFDNPLLTDGSCFRQAVDTGCDLRCYVASLTFPESLATAQFIAPTARLERRLLCVGNAGETPPGMSLQIF